MKEKSVWRITVFSPCYNEEANIEEFFERLASVSKEVKKHARIEALLVFDDGSTDKTPEILERISKKNRFVRIFRNKENKGAGATAERGYSIAVSSFGDGERRIVMRMDADLEHPPELIPKIVSLHEKESDVVVVQLTYSPKNGLADYLFNAITGFIEGRRILGKGLTQFCPGMMSFKANAIKKILPEAVSEAKKFEKQNGKPMLAIDLLLLAIARKNKARISVVSSRVPERVYKNRSLKKIVNYIKTHFETMEFLESRNLLVGGSS